jgi:NTE family protein
MPNDAPRLGLVLPGGGARGAWQAGALEAIAGFLDGGANPFRVIVGQSAGAINAAALAMGADDVAAAAARIAALWSGLRVCDVYRTDAVAVGRRAALWMAALATGGWAARKPLSFFDNAPLARLLARELDFDAVRRRLAAGDLDALGVTASAYAAEAGHAATFFEARDGAPGWRRARRCGIPARLTVDHVRASSALPFLFPAERLDGRWFGDGALRLTAPLSPAIALGADRILALSPRDPPGPPLDRTATGAHPSLGALAGHMLDVIFNDDLDADLEHLARVNDLVAGLTPDAAAQSPVRRIDAFVLQPSQDLRVIAARHADAMPGPIRLILRGIGGWGGDWRLPSYLNFDGGYCRELVALGRADATAARARIEPLLRAAVAPDDLKATRTEETPRCAS